jgi:uncharacterized protein (DUF4415 family)
MAKRRVTRSAPTAENPEWTKETSTRAKRLDDIPALAALSKRRQGERGPQRAPTKEPISIRLDQFVVEYFRAKGKGWQAEINNALVHDVIRARRGDTLISTLRQAYGSDFAPGVRSDRRLADIIDQLDEPSLRKLKA